MKILSLTAGAADMYCGSCLRDNALARELMARGHDVVLVPVYTPTKVDGRNVSGQEVLFGGISVYLQQHWPLFRRTPWMVDRLLDSSWALRMASKRSVEVNPKFLGEMTISMLEGGHGPLAKEFAKLESWLSRRTPPDLVILPNALLIAMARSIKQVFRGPVACTLQGEDLFLDNLEDAYRGEAMAMIRARVSDVDGFIAVSEFYRDYMARYFEIPSEKMHVVRLGVDTRDVIRKSPHEGPFTVSYLARIAPEKGLHILCAAWREFRLRTPDAARLRVAGYLAPEHRPYLEGVRNQMKDWGYEAEFLWEGELERDAKMRYLSEADVFTVPAAYDDPKGLYVLEAMAAGVPVVAPARGALCEHLEITGGGLLVEPDNPAEIADAWLRLKSDSRLAADLGERGRRGIAQHYSVGRMAQQALDVYRELLLPQKVSA